MKTPVRKTLSVRKRLAYSAVVAVLLFAVCEGMVRLAGFRSSLPIGEVRPSANAYFWISDHRLGFRNRADGQYRYRDIRGQPVSTTDRYGFRNGLGWAADGDQPLVGLFGDSTVFCAEVPDDRTVTSELARVLDQRGVRAGVLNAGVRGYSTLQTKRMLEQCLQRFPRLRVAVYCYCGNDLPETYSGDIYLPAKAPHLEYSGGTGVYEVVEVADPVVPWGEGFLPLVAEEHRRRLAVQRNKRFDQRARDWLREQSALVHFILSVAAGEWTESAENARREGADAALAEYQSVKMEGVDSVMARLLADMQEACREAGISFLVTSATTGRESPGLADHCRRAGVRYVPLHEHFSGDPNDYRARLREPGYDPHYGPKGTRTFARALAPAIVEALEARSGD